jgi:quinol monooxygenase YgiN
MMKEKDPEQAREVHNAIFGSLRSVGDELGSVGHQTYLNPQNPGEFLAIDTWPGMDSLQKFMGHPANPGPNIGSMFEGQPDIVVWVESGYDGFYKA